MLLYMSTTLLLHVFEFPKMQFLDLLCFEISKSSIIFIFNNFFCKENHEVNNIFEDIISQLNGTFIISFAGVHAKPASPVFTATLPNGLISEKKLDPL